MESSAELQTANTPALTERERDLLNTLQQIANTVLEPNAQLTDQGRHPVAENLRALATAGLVGVTTPLEWGGQGASGAFMREYTERLTAACGTTWFVLTQHLGACNLVGMNTMLRERYQRKMAAGEHYVGVGFGHLRRPQPMLMAEETNGGWVLNGVAPWVTGWNLLQGVVFGATLPDERHLYVYVPAEESKHLVSSPPLPLCAMQHTMTTEVALRDLFVPEECFIKYSSRAEMAAGDRNGIAGNVHPALGCARGSLKVLQQAAETRKIPAIGASARAVEAEINACRSEARRWVESPKDAPDYEAGALNARAWAIELGVRAAHRAVAASSGGANSLDHPAQRLFREAMFYTLTAQTSAVLSATLARLDR